MDQKHRKQITRNINLLIQRGMLSYQRIRPHVLEKRIFTLRMIQDIDAEKTEVEQLRKLLQDLCTRGPLAFHKFIDILSLVGHTDAIKILLPDNEHFTTFEADNNARKERSEVDSSAPLPVPLKTTQVPVVGGSIKEKDAVVMPWVKLATVWIEGDKIYEMSCAPRGLCFILNNVNFTSSKRERRNGSEKNVKYLEMVFKDLGFVVESHEDKTAKEIMSLLNTFASRKEHEKLDCCVVILMSHGEKNVIEGIHSNLVYLDEVFDLFNNDNCSALINKPKIFFVNACRGARMDYGVAIPPYRKVSYDGTPFGQSARTRVPVWTDMLICYCTVEGCRAVRDSDYGSWFIHYLVYVLIEKAWNTDLHTILQEVEDKMQKTVGKDGEKQSAEIVSRGFHKKLYFNPGLYK